MRTRLQRGSSFYPKPISLRLIEAADDYVTGDPEIHLAHRPFHSLPAQSAQERPCRRSDVLIHPRVRLKDPILARGDGTVVDGHLRLKAARKLGSWPGGDITGLPVILCDEWTEAQVKAFRILVNRSATRADFDDELLSLELQDLAAADFPLDLTGFDPRELEDLLLLPDADEQAEVAPPLPENPVSRLGDLWLCGNRRNQHRVRA